MSKNKKLVKINKRIKKYFDDDGFDEGIERVEEEVLIELALSLPLRIENLVKANIVKALRRLWSDAELPTRQIILGFFADRGTIYQGDATKDPLERKEKMIKEVFSQIQADEIELSILKSELLHVKAGKISVSLAKEKLLTLRQKRASESIIKTLGLSFVAYEDYEFVHRFVFDFEEDSFTKLLTLNLKLPLTLFAQENAKELIEELMQNIVSKKEGAIAKLLETLKDSRYLERYNAISLLKQLHPDSSLDAIFIDEKSLKSILEKEVDNRFFFELNASSVTFYKESHYLNRDFFTQVVLNKEYFYKCIWQNLPLNLESYLLAQEKESIESFEAEIEALEAELIKKAHLTNLSKEQIKTFIQEHVYELLGSKLTLKRKHQRRVLEEFERMVHQLRIKEQKEELLARSIRDYKSLFPLARELKRKLVFNVGPTNSGKTYSATQKLIEADTGYYLAPLRLLAMQGYDKLLEHKIAASLITGEEEFLDENAAHISSTIEMTNYYQEVDVAVIDEVQMIADRDRGWAWTNAIIGVPAKEVIMTGSVDALAAVELLANYLNEPLEINYFERKNDLVAEDVARNLYELEPKTAVIAFSRREVLNIKNKLLNNYKVSVIYGNLSPEVRREESRRFREGESDILVATDAIAMGLNLPIKTVIFSKDSKFDGERQRKLNSSEIKQISGRAGRLGFYEKGYVGAVSSSILKTVKRTLHEELRPLKPPFNVMANVKHIELISKILGTKNLTSVLEFYSRNMEFNGPLKAINIESMIEAAKIVDSHKLSLADKFTLSCAPISSAPSVLRAFEHYISCVEEQKPLNFATFTPESTHATTLEELLIAEDKIKEISLYLWLSFKFSDIFVDTENAKTQRYLINSYIQRSLAQNKFQKTCRSCGKKLSLNYEFNICQTCFRKKAYLPNRRGRY